MNEFQLSHRRFKVWSPGNPIEESDIANLENNIGIRLPTQLRSYYQNWNGGSPYPFDLPDDSSVWVRLLWKSDAPAAEAGEAAILNEIFRINADPEHDFLRTRKDFVHRIPSDCLCFARDPGGSLFLIGTQASNLGRIYFWQRSYEADIEAGESPSYSNIADVADSFEDFLLALREEPKPDESLDTWVRRVYHE